MPRRFSSRHRSYSGRLRWRVHWDNGCLGSCPGHETRAGVPSGPVLPCDKKQRSKISSGWPRLREAPPGTTLTIRRGGVRELSERAQRVMGEVELHHP